MKDDPFSRLTGLDQRLYTDNGDPNKEARKRVDKETRQQANKPATLSPSNVPSKEATNHGEQPPTIHVSQQATNERSNPASQPTRNEATRPRASSLSGQVRVPRLVERHTYDVFKDQVRWLNRLKLDIEELHNERVFVNSFVQLAIDLLREDYEVNGERSHLVRVLIRKQPIRVKATSAERERGG